MAYYQAVDRFWHGITPYQPGPYWSFIYPPGFLFLFSWLKYIPLSRLVYLWPALSILCLWWVISALTKEVRFYVRGLIFILFLNWFPVKFTLGMGQINLLVLVLFVLFYLAMMKQKKLLAGLVLGALVSIKITPVLFLIWLIRMKKWGMCLVTGFSIVIFNSIAFMKLPAFALTEFVAITKGGLVANSTYYFNQSWVAALSRSFAFHGGQLLARIIVSIFIFTMVYRLKKFDLRNFCLMLLLTTMVSPVTWQHHLVGLIPAIIYLFKEGKRLGWLLLGILLTGFNLVNPAVWVNFAIVYSLAAFGAFILFYLLFKSTRITR